MKLKRLLNEIINEVGEGTSEPFEYNFLGQAGEKRGWYIEGKTSDGKDVDIILEALIHTEYMDDEGGGVPREIFDEIGKNTLKSAEVEFRIDFGKRVPYEMQYIEVNDKVYMYRLMATLKRILLPFIKENEVDVIEYIPSSKGGATNNDKGEGRDRLYALFLKKTFPNTKKFTSADNVYFVLK